FGRGNGELGYEPSNESATGEPGSFAVAPDGSIWILDGAKQRLAHYSTAGVFLGSVQDVGPHTQDVVFLGSTMIVLANQEGDALLVQPRGPLTPARIGLEGDAPQVTDLIPASSGLYAQLGDLVRVNGVLPSGF